MACRLAEKDFRSGFDGHHSRVRKNRQLKKKGTSHDSALFSFSAFLPFTLRTGSKASGDRPPPATFHHAMPKFGNRRDFASAHAPDLPVPRRLKPFPQRWPYSFA